MPPKRKRTPEEEARILEESKIYRSKLRKLNCRKNDELKMSDIANKSVPLERKKLPPKIFKPKQPSRSGKNKRTRSKKGKSKAARTTATNSQEFVTPLCENGNNNLRTLDSFTDTKSETKHEIKIKDVIDLSRKTNSSISNSKLECDKENKFRRDSTEQNGNHYLRALDSFTDAKLETKHEIKIIKTAIDLSKKTNSPILNSKLECDKENKFRRDSTEQNGNHYLRALDSFTDTKLETKHEIIDLSKKINSPTLKSTLECDKENKFRKDSTDQNLTQDDAILSPEYSSIKGTKAKACLETFRAKFDLSNSILDSNRLSEDVVDSAKYIPTEKHGATSNDLCIPVISTAADRIHAELHIGEKADEANFKICVIQRKHNFAEIESNTLEYSDSSKKTIDKEIVIFSTTITKLPKEIDEVDVFSSSNPAKKSKIVYGNVLFSFKAPGEKSFQLKHFLEENKGCPRYAIQLEDISNKYEFFTPILKPIQNYQLPAEFTVHVEQYFFIQNCPVVKCLSYQQFPHTSTNVCTFLCATPSKIPLPNFIIKSAAPTSLPVLYNKRLHTFFENFMDIYSELKVGNNFILNLFTDNESPISAAYPLQLSTEHDNIIFITPLIINKARPTVIMETESIKNCDLYHPCLFKKFGNSKFGSLNKIPDAILENLKGFSSERQPRVYHPFTVQKDSCSCMFVDPKIALACPIKAFLLAFTNNIQFIQSRTHIDSTARPLEGIHTCALQKIKCSPELDGHNISKELKPKITNITRKPLKVTPLKKLESKINVDESSTAARTVARPLECIHTCALQKRKCSSELDGHNISKKLKPKIIKIRRKPLKVSRRKKLESKINVDESSTLRTVERKRDLQTIEKNMPKVKRLKTQAETLFDKNILPPNFRKQKPSQCTVTSPHKLKYSEKDGMISLDGNIKVLTAVSREFSQSKSPKRVAMTQLPEMKNLPVQKRISLPSSEFKSIEHYLASKSEFKCSKHPSVSKASESSNFQTLLRTTPREYNSQKKSVLSMNVEDNRPVCLVKISNTHNSSMQVALKHSPEMAKRKNNNVRCNSHSSSELKNLEGLNSHALTNSKSSISKDLEFFKDLPPSSQNSASPSISNLVQNMSFTANNIQTSIKTINIPTKSEQIGKKLNVLINSKTLSCQNIKLSNLGPINPQATTQPTRLRCAQSSFLGFMEVHFYEHIRRRNRSLPLSVIVPNMIKKTSLAIEKMRISPNAILSQTVAGNPYLIKTFIHVRKITSIEEIKGTIFDHKNTSAPSNGFDKQTFMFQLSGNQNKLPQHELENLRNLTDSHLPKGIYQLTPIKKNGASEIKIYMNLKFGQLNELKKEIGICYNLGKECVEVKDLLNIPDHLFCTSNVQLSDIL